ARLAIMNTAKSGFFAADRAIREYAQNIWHVDV
ncbi:MAG: glycogen/starch/alpha-glucan phosphorylase, partial [Oscillospiraceae bacterium]|nr:glycogen/starch/alpha-glucan phosphorylase [Oscillospiraceae bacterium]